MSLPPAATKPVQQPALVPQRGGGCIEEVNMNQENDIYDLQAGLYQSLSSPVRLRIIHALISSAKSVNDISAEIGISQSSVSRHLAVLRSAGILTAHRRAQEVFYEITNPKVVEVCEMMRCILAEHGARQLDLLHSNQA
jgi:ArsR family transcriptional regulator, virulence genes transcriptional regulator